MTEKESKEKIDQMFALVDRVVKVRGVGDLKSFSLSWDIVHTGGTEAEMLPRISVEYWAAKTLA